LDGTQIDEVLLMRLVALQKVKIATLCSMIRSEACVVSEGQFKLVVYFNYPICQDSHHIIVDIDLRALVQPAILGTVQSCSKEVLVVVL